MNDAEFQDRLIAGLQENSGNFDDFLACVQDTTVTNDVPFAKSVDKNVPIYHGKMVNKLADDPVKKRALMLEWVRVLYAGAGIIVIKKAIADTEVIDQASAVFDRIILSEKNTDPSKKSDHFAQAGANDRIWNALEKHCLTNPENFAAYYGSTPIALVCEAWLGVGYQMSAQVNRVNPRSAAQKPHRDYHLGFMTPKQMMRYPAHIHQISPVLTLQGAISHIDMTIESGSTQFLPFSQRYFEGYLAYGRPEFQEYFMHHFVQFPLNKGDAVFFNPAVMHGAGENRTQDTYRLSNLLQVSSAFGRAMESIDRRQMLLALYRVLLQQRDNQRLTDAVIAASAEGYAFPTNLDRNPPIGGIIPATQAEITYQALEQRFSLVQYRTALDQLAYRNTA